MESPSQSRTGQIPENALVITKENVPGPASENSIAQTDSPGAGDWQEEIYQMIKNMKNQYLPELSDLCSKASIKLQYIDNHMPAQKLTEQYEKMKNFKLMLERTLQFLQIEKKSVQRSFKDNIPVFERQIFHIVNSKKRKPVQAFQQSAGQSPSSNSSTIPVDSTAQTDYSGADDWQEELFQKIKILKNQYLSKLSDVYNKVCMKLQHTDNPMQAHKLTEQYEKMKSFKLIVERIMKLLQIDKTCIQLSFKDKIPAYVRQIVHIINYSPDANPTWTFEQSTGQSTRSNTTEIHVHSAARTGYPGAGGLHEELYQMNRTLENQYLAGISDLYEISTKLHADSHMPPQKPTDQYEQMNNFRLMLERSLHSLKIGNSSVQPALDGKIPIYKRQIISILNSEEWNLEQTLQQSAGQARSTSSSKRSKPSLNDDIINS